MVFQAAEPELDQLRIAANAAWLEGAQIKPGQRGAAGCWTYTEVPQGGDNSNTQYALLGLNAASEAGVPGQTRGLGTGARPTGREPSGGMEAGGTMPAIRFPLRA